MAHQHMQWLGYRRAFGWVCSSVILGCSSSAPSATDQIPEPAAPALQPIVARSKDCSTQEITVSRVVPTVWLVVDGSGSMLEALSPLDGTTRWDALRSALLDPQTGVVRELEQSVRWGLLAYDGPLPVDDAPEMACPRFVLTEASLDNYSVLDQAYPSVPLGGSTPTNRALETLIGRLPALSPDDQGPSIVVLATDGQPNDFCTNVPAQDIKNEVLDDVQQLAAAGHDVYVISLAGDDAGLTRHLTDLAAASGTGLPLFMPQDTAELGATLRTLLGTPAVCELLLPQPIVLGKEHEAQVELNGKALEYEQADGWHLKDPHTIELTGSACAAYKREWPAVLHAELACEILAP